MADAILYGVAQKIIESLGSSALQHVGSIWGVKDELEKMKKTVLTIQAVLQDAEEQQVQNHHVKLWLMELREVVFDADDLLSEFSTHVLRQNVMEGSKMTKKVRVFFSSSNQLAFGFKMACKIKAMRERLNDIAKNRNDFRLVERPLGTVVVTRKRDQSHSFVREEDVIGREEDKKAIIGQLLDFVVGENVSFISIVGIGGLGKTTLVQYIYNDAKIKAFFELKMWVCVSNDFDVKSIVESIITSATGEKPKNLDMDQLQIELREKLSQKKYLLVLDDVWNEDKEIWFNLKTLLLDGSKGSKVVITTRNNLVADITGTMQYFLEGLSNDQSWLLLKQMAFEKKQDTINPNFEAIGRGIVAKCCGVPLAIKAIGRVLYYKKTESEWSYIKDNELKNVIKLKNDIFPVLKLSYDHLPPHLKCCFAFCSLFPKDYLIEKLTLIRLWIAQGFIHSQEENLRLEDIANEYFEDLLWRSFFQVVEEDKGMFMNFKMHDLIHDLAQSISSVECTLVNSNAKHVNEKVRHISIPFYNDSFFGENLNSLVKANKIRTFILTFHKLNHQVEVEVEESTLKKLISAFGYIRALDLHSLKIKTLPNIIGKLMHLKYLDLSYNDIEVLPDSVTRLVNLHTLKLISCEKLRELPIDIQKLVNLKHLEITECYRLTHMPYGLGRLTPLQTLTLFVVSEDPVGSSKHCGGLAELNKLNDLRGEIVIKNLKWVKDATSDSKTANLKGKQHLNTLSLEWGLDNVADAGDDENLLDGLQPHQNLKSLTVHGYGGARFSIWLSSLTNLSELYMYNCKKCQHLPPLYQLPSLKTLFLSDMDSLEYISDSDINDEVSASLLTTFFPSLESLVLSSCCNLKGWWKGSIVDNSDPTAMTSTSWSNQYQQHISLPSFPRLCYLEICQCSLLTSMPLFPYLDDTLDLKNTSLKALQQTMAMKMNMAGASSLPSSFPPLSKLKYLSLKDVQDTESLPKEWLQNLTSLEELTIWDCPRLTSLSQYLRHNNSLKMLNISGCEEVDLFNDVDDDGAGRPKRLQCLILTEVTKMECLPVYLQHVTTLQYLFIAGCPSLITLPEWIGSLTSLQNLVIDNCPNMTSLPEEMSRLASLQILSILDCPHLDQRCQKEVGEDWNKIAHRLNQQVAISKSNFQKKMAFGGKEVRDEESIGRLIKKSNKVSRINESCH